MSSSSSSSSSSGGIGVLGLLGVVFTVLKLGGWTQVADWSWWWVTLPFWGGIVIALAIVAGLLLMALVSDLMSAKKR